MRELKKLPDYLKSDLMDSFHWSDLNGITLHELNMLHNIALTNGYDLDILIVVQFWQLFSVSWNAQFLTIDWHNQKPFIEFIENWIKVNKS